MSSPGASLLAACEQLPLDPAAHAVWRLRSEAMLEPHDSSMGGCLYGEWWQFPIRRKALTIPVLELLAATGWGRRQTGLGTYNVGLGTWA